MMATISANRTSAAIDNPTARPTVFDGDDTAAVDTDVVETTSAE